MNSVVPVQLKSIRSRAERGSGVHTVRISSFLSIEVPRLDLSLFIRKGIYLLDSLEDFYVTCR